MQKRSYNQVKQIATKKKSEINKLFPRITNETGIYFMLRIDEAGIKHGYIGQSVNILDRLISHCLGYQYIDISLKKHGFYSKENIYGYRLHQIVCNEGDLNELEQFYIKKYADAGYQLKNRTSGSQGEGKLQIGEYKPHKTYREGVVQGEENARKFVANLFEKHLDYKVKSDKPNKNQEKAIEKFKEFLLPPEKDN